jgi:hypothetical protein
MRLQKKLHDAQTGLGAHGGKHVGVTGDVGGGRHISIIAEIWDWVKG